MLDNLAEFYHTTKEELKKKTILELEEMEDTMKISIVETKRAENAANDEYSNIIRKYWTPYEHMRQYWTDEEIIKACVLMDISISDVVDEKKLEAAKDHGHTLHGGEYLRTEYGSVPQYDRYGREFMERKHCEVNVYRVKAQYQGLCHGKVYEHLLYKKYPQLSKYGFKFYENSCNSYPYEIYPDNNVYTPFDALMNKDVDAIIERNRSYAKASNYGEYTSAKVEERLASPEVQEYFDTIRNM
jgi:hypothetical protein